MLPSGYPRRQKPITAQEDEVASVPPEPSSMLSATASTSFAESSKPGKRESEFSHDELPEVKALLKAQRARTPVALAVAQDLDSVPFRVTEPFMVLGWFWVVESWVGYIIFLPFRFTSMLK